MLNAKIELHYFHEFPAISDAQEFKLVCALINYCKLVNNIGNSLKNMILISKYLLINILILNINYSLPVIILNFQNINYLQSTLIYNEFFIKVENK